MLVPHFPRCTIVHKARIDSVHNIFCGALFYIHALVKFGHDLSVLEIFHPGCANTLVQMPCWTSQWAKLKLVDWISSTSSACKADWKPSEMRNLAFVLPHINCRAISESRKTWQKKGSRNRLLCLRESCAQLEMLFIVLLHLWHPLHSALLFGTGLTGIDGFSSSSQALRDAWSQYCVGRGQVWSGSLNEVSCTQNKLAIMKHKFLPDISSWVISFSSNKYNSYISTHTTDLNACEYFVLAVWSRHIDFMKLYLLHIYN